jgi:hypothetical protein
MKTGIVKSFLWAAALVMVFSACKDRAAEKRIAELESRLADLEGKKSATPSANPTVTTPEVKPEGPLPIMEFDKLEHDFGNIKEGDIVEHTYVVKNTGEAPLIIQSAQPSCGCTVPDFSKDPIPVGGTGFVKAKFDSNGKPNVQNKSITVTANTFPKQTVIRFKAMVTPKAGGSTPPAK